MKRNIKYVLAAGFLLLLTAQPRAWGDNVIDEVIWIVGDEPILKSEVEAQRVQAQLQGVRLEKDPYCLIPEQLAIQKLFLHQASLDSIDVKDEDLRRYVEGRMAELTRYAGSVERLEENYRMSIAQIREQLMELARRDELTSDVKRKIAGSVKVTPAEVRRYFKDMPADSLPYVPLQVEVQILTMEPPFSKDEIERVETDLREYTDRINKGESFSTLARMYSEDGSSRTGGDLMEYKGRGELVPEFATVAFNLTDPKKVSKIVKTEYGYHIIQLINKQGEKVRVRHILRKPKLSNTDIQACMLRLDSIAADIRKKTFSFEEAVSNLSDDKNTRKNSGIMANIDMNDPRSKTSKFEMRDLPAEVADKVKDMQVGDVSNAFLMTHLLDGKQVCAIIKLKSRSEGHRANLNEDFQLLKEIVENHDRSKLIDQWIREKIKTTYVKIKDGWRNCDFEYPEWIKN